MDAWDFPESFRAPDQRVTLRYSNLREISGWGGPLIGALRIEPSEIDFAARRFGGPPVWSEDARYVAIPEWAQTHDAFGADHFSWQVLTIFDLQEMREATRADKFSVIQIEAFQAGAIRGVDSPRHQPRAFSASIENSDWRALGARQTPVVRAIPMPQQIAGCAVLPIVVGILTIYGVIYRVGNWIRDKDE
ncbi:MAG: hypothetical protein HZC40_22365 [Chloroflexi bacterium]|nr:hypothetical protein [Chloroflexota bacterium]